MASCIGRRMRLVFPASRLGSSWLSGQEDQEPDRREFPTSLRHKLLFSLQSPLSSSCQPCVAPASAPQGDLKGKKVLPRKWANKLGLVGHLKKNIVKFCMLAYRINDDGGQMTKTKLMTVEMVRERWVVAPSSWRRGQPNCIQCG